MIAFYSWALFFDPYSSLTDPNGWDFLLSFLAINFLYLFLLFFIIVRKSVVAGMFYADNLGDLDNQISSCFNSKFGPGDLPISRRDKNIIGVIYDT